DVYPGVHLGGGGSGGSVWIEADVLTGTGSIQADGGHALYSAQEGRGGGGAGGRIAIYAATDVFSGVVQARGGGGYEAGEAGTIYLDEVDPLSSTITAAPTAGLVANGVETATITVTLLTAGGYPVPSKAVFLEFTAGTGNWIAGVPVTSTQTLIGTSSPSGTVTATLASTRAEVKTVVAWAESVRLTMPATVTFVAGPPDGDTSQVWASLAEVAADGITTATVHVRVYDAYLNPAAGATVELTTTAAGVTLTQPAGPTDAAGRTWGAVRCPTPQVVTVTATADGAPISDAAQVTFAGADLVVSKDGPATALAGRPVTYTLLVVNEGLLTAEGVVLTDTLPEGTSFLTQTSSFPFTHTPPSQGGVGGGSVAWQLGSLAKDAQVGFELAATVAPTMAHRAQITNQAAVAAASPETDNADNTAAQTTTVYQPAPQLEMTPAYSELTLRRGATQTVALEVENVGTAATGELIVAAAPHLEWMAVAPTTWPGLMPGEGGTVTVTLAPPGDQPVGVYRDVATAQVVGSGYPQTGAAFAVRVVGITRTLVVTVSDGYGPVAGAGVHLVRREESLLVTEGVTKTVHDRADGQSGGDGMAVLDGLEVGAYDYTIVAEGRGAAQGVVTVTAPLTEQVQTLTVTLSGLPLLRPEPFHPELHVRPGETGYVEAAARNVGLGAATNVNVAVAAGGPDWLTVGLIGATDALTAGQALSVTLFARPPATLTTPAVYRQYVDVTWDDAPATRFALTVHVSSQETGRLQVRVTDRGGEPVEGARVTVVNKERTLLVSGPITQTYYESVVGETGAGGVVTFEELAVGRYEYRVEAEGYAGVSVDPEVGAGEACFEEVELEGLPFEMRWEVEETEISDVYSVTVHLTFEADKLQLLPLEIEGACAGGTVEGVIE
ncbi:MAG TPA: DUF11 domain-containing protein, partial [Chloroflexi bacterium]|nr:DUF11 domain-containing protein [Chloroflexota bacterium]